MQRVALLVCVVDRDRGDKLFTVLSEGGAHVVFTCNATGTAKSHILDYLGLGETEKSMVYTLLPLHMIKKIMRRLVVKLAIDVPGNGIAFTIPVTTVGGSSLVKTLGELTDGKEEEMQDNISHELIIAIANRGYSEMVMDAARANSATGGTVVHARGTVTEDAAKFFGISVAPEKDMIFIVANAQNKARIMKGIMKEAGSSSRAKTVLFSLPVSGIVGLREIGPDEDDE